MKTLTHLGRGLAFAYLLASSLFSASCSRKIDGEGDYVRQSRALTGFTGVQLGMTGRAEIYKGNDFSVVVEAQPNIQEHIETRIEGGSLIIDSRKNLGSFKEPHYLITVPNLESVDLSSSGAIEVRDTFSPSSINLSLSGSGSVSGAFMAPVNASVSGSGQMTLRGSTDRLAANVSGSGSIDALDMPAKVANCSVSGSGSISTAVSDELQATISGSGNVRYRGNPPVINSNVSGSGRLIKL